MKTVITVLATAVAFIAQSMARDYGYNDETDSFGFVMTSEPIFPIGLQNAGIEDGFASFLVVINREGALEDYIVLEASHEGFARSVEAAMKRWRFHKPKIGGKPVTLAQSFSVKFNSRGTVVTSGDASSVIDIMMNRLNPHSNPIRLYSAEELDDFLEPVHIEKPTVHNDYLSNEEITEFTLDFFVDKQGNVRIPLLREESKELDDRLIFAAQRAIERWKFIPPTVKGKPVVARAAQPFRFHRSSSASILNSSPSER
ncbi:MAG: energy transducer TonB [Verrucomicrobiota bacterium]